MILKNEHELRMATANRLRNEATQELSLELKRMPTEEEISMRVCTWLARAHDARNASSEPSKADMIEAGYWPKENDNE